MVIDTSALMAVLQDEPERERLNEAIVAAERRLVSVASFVEVSTVTEARRGPAGVRELDSLLELMNAELVPVDAAQGRIARSAFSRFGKGRHPAGLNFGDCFSYALAQAIGQPLLFKGDDFTQTDVVPAPY